MYQNDYDFLTFRNSGVLLSPLNILVSICSYGISKVSSKSQTALHGGEKSDTYTLIVILLLISTNKFNCLLVDLHAYQLFNCFIATLY